MFPYWTPSQQTRLAAPTAAMANNRMDSLMHIISKDISVRNVNIQQSLTIFSHFAEKHGGQTWIKHGSENWIEGVFVVYLEVYNCEAQFVYFESTMKFCCFKHLLFQVIRPGLPVASLYFGSINDTVWIVGQVLPHWPRKWRWDIF